MTGLINHIIQNTMSAPEHMDKDRLDDFLERASNIEEHGDPDTITTFVEISLTRDQVALMRKHLIDMGSTDLFDYYRRKIHNDLCLTDSYYTTTEDRADIQFLVDLGIKALETDLTKSTPWPSR